jgi:hypothetical protein
VEDSAVGYFLIEVVLLLPLAFARQEGFVLSLSAQETCQAY